MLQSGWNWDNHELNAQESKHSKEFLFQESRNEYIRGPTALLWSELGWVCIPGFLMFRISGIWHIGWCNYWDRLQQYRNDYFRYLLGVLVRFIKVSFKVNKGNRLGDFGYCPLNRGCPLNTGFTAVKDWSHGKQLIFFQSNRLPGKIFTISHGISH